MRNHPIQTTDQVLERRHFIIKSLIACGGALFGHSLLAADAMGGMDMSEHEHHHHHALDPAAAVKRSIADYAIPALDLVRDDGSAALFPREVDDGRAVILNFVYTSCTAVCPLTSQVFSQVQKMLNKDIDKVHMISISIDPEYDTPERLAAYARKYHRSAHWQFYTGTVKDSIAMQKAFNAYRGDKMNHIPLTFMREAPGKSWVRLDGFANPDEVIREFRSWAKS